MLRLQPPRDMAVLVPSQTVESIGRQSGTPDLEEDFVRQKVQGAAAPRLDTVQRLGLLTGTAPPRHLALRAPQENRAVRPAPAAYDPPRSDTPSNGAMFTQWRGLTS